MTDFPVEPSASIEVQPGVWLDFYFSLKHSGISVPNPPRPPRRLFELEFHAGDPDSSSERWPLEGAVRGVLRIPAR